MSHVIVAQSRGDASRLAEWVTYHSRLGFQEFHIVLDGLVDHSDEVLDALDVDAEVRHYLKPEQGEYYDGLTVAEHSERILRWGEENADLVASLPYTACDIRTVTRDAPAPRLRLLNHNVSTVGHDPSRPVLEQHQMRWSREDLENYPFKAWTNRIKTIARFRHATPYNGIHHLTPGPHHVVSPDVARLHHFRVPEQPMPAPLPYSVDDPITMPPPRVRRTQAPAPPPATATFGALERLRRRLVR